MPRSLADIDSLLAQLRRDSVEHPDKREIIRQARALQIAREKILAKKEQGDLFKEGKRIFWCGADYEENIETPGSTFDGS